MDKQKALEWLIENVTKWPVKLINMRKPDGWRWMEIIIGNIYLISETPAKTFSHGHIGQDEWLSAVDVAVKHIQQTVGIADITESKPLRSIEGLDSVYVSNIRCSPAPIIKPMSRTQALEWLFTRYWGIQGWPTVDNFKSVLPPAGWMWTTTDSGRVYLSSTIDRGTIDYDDLSYWVNKHKTPPPPKPMSQSQAFDWLYDNYATKLDEWPSSDYPQLDDLPRPGVWSWFDNTSRFAAVRGHAVLIPPPTDGDSEAITFHNLETYVKNEIEDTRPMSRGEAIEWLYNNYASKLDEWPDSIRYGLFDTPCPVGWSWGKTIAAKAALLVAPADMNCVNISLYNLETYITDRTPDALKPKFTPRDDALRWLAKCTNYKLVWPNYGEGMPGFEMPDGWCWDAFNIGPELPQVVLKSLHGSDLISKSAFESYLDSFPPLQPIGGTPHEVAILINYLNQHRLKYPRVIK